VKIKTTRFGTIHLNDTQVIQMPDGMLGFPDSKRFVIIQNKENSPFFWYQSLDDPDLAFVITNPNDFVPTYQPDIDKHLESVSWIDLNKVFKQAACYVVVNIPRGAPEEMTANFMGPVVVDTKCRMAVQLVLSDAAYSHKTRLLSGSTAEQPVA
jgi:flagellar assembly factor FliW